MTDYTKQAEDFLTRHNLEFRAVLIGNDCPGFCSDAEKDIDMDKVDTYPRRTHIHGKHYRCTFSGSGRGHVAFDFWSSYADEEKNAFAGQWPKPLRDWELNNMGREDRKLAIKYAGKKRTKVSAYDVIACITKSNPGYFEDFCGDYGYDNDSRKAEATYHAVVGEWNKVRRFFTPTEIEEMQEIN